MTFSGSPTFFLEPCQSLKVPSRLVIKSPLSSCEPSSSNTTPPAKEVRTDDSGSFVCYRGGGTVHNVLLLKPCTKANLTILQKHKFLSQCPIVTLLKSFKLIVVSGEHLTLDEMWPQLQQQAKADRCELRDPLRKSRSVHFKPPTCNRDQLCKIVGPTKSPGGSQAELSKAIKQGTFTEINSPKKPSKHSTYIIGMHNMVQKIFIQRSICHYSQLYILPQPM